MIDEQLTLMEFDSLPPMNLNTQNAEAERILAREFFEYAVIYSIQTSDKDSFQRYVSSLRPYYIGYCASISESDMKYTIIGLNLLFLLVENRLADFHSEVSSVYECSMLEFI